MRVSRHVGRLAIDDALESCSWRPNLPLSFFPFTRTTRATMSDVQEPSKVSTAGDALLPYVSPGADARPMIPQSNANWNSTVGGIKETVGNVTGITSLAQSGSEQRASGEAEYKLAQTQEYVEGTADRIGGKVDRVLGAVTGDKAKEASGLAQETKGKAQQGELPWARSAFLPAETYSSGLSLLLQPPTPHSR